MKKHCSRCGVVFDEPDEDWWALCGEGENNCSGEVDIYDPYWLAVGKIINMDLNEIMLSDIADHDGIWLFIDRLMDAKDHDTKLNWLKKQAEKLK